MDKTPGRLLNHFPAFWCSEVICAKEIRPSTRGTSHDEAARPLQQQPARGGAVAAVWREAVLKLPRVQSQEVGFLPPLRSRGGTGYSGFQRSDSGPGAVRWCSSFRDSGGSGGGLGHGKAAAPLGGGAS